jgi:hypothetical protein
MAIRACNRHFSFLFAIHDDDDDDESTMILRLSAQNETISLIFISFGRIRGYNLCHTDELPLDGHRVLSPIEI